MPHRQDVRDRGREETAEALTSSGVVRAGDAGTVAFEVARSAVGLLGALDGLRIRECGHAKCTRIFIDRSRAGNRQWCGMEECGNRIKAADYRSRKSRAPTSVNPPTTPPTSANDRR